MVRTEALDPCVRGDDTLRRRPGGSAATRDQALRRWFDFNKIEATVELVCQVISTNRRETALHRLRSAGRDARGRRGDDRTRRRDAGRRDADGRGPDGLGDALVHRDDGRPDRPLAICAQLRAASDGRSGRTNFARPEPLGRFAVARGNRADQERRRSDLRHDEVRLPARRRNQPPVRLRRGRQGHRRRSRRSRRRLTQIKASRQRSLTETYRRQTGASRASNV